MDKNTAFDSTAELDSAERALDRQRQAQRWRYILRDKKALFGLIALTVLVTPPDVPTILERCEESGLAFDMMQTTFFLSHETLVTQQKGGMARWRQRLFGRMSRNSLQPTAYFGIPPNRVVELGMQVQL